MLRTVIHSLYGGTVKQNRRSCRAGRTPRRVLVETRIYQPAHHGAAGAVFLISNRTVGSKYFCGICPQRCTRSGLGVHAARAGPHCRKGTVVLCCETYLALSAHV